MAHAARASKPRAPDVVIPDVRAYIRTTKSSPTVRRGRRGRLAIDFFARTAPSEIAVRASTSFSCAADEATPSSGHRGGRTYLKARTREARSIFSVGFCFGGALSYLQAASGLGYSGVIVLRLPLVSRGRTGPSRSTRVHGYKCGVCPRSAADQESAKRPWRFRAAGRKAGRQARLTVLPGGRTAFSMQQTGFRRLGRACASVQTFVAPNTKA